MAVAAESGVRFLIRPCDAEATAAPGLSDGDAHVWILPLTATSARSLSLQGLLSAEELERAARFRFEKHRVHYALTRGMLRRLLGAYLSVSPHQIAFRYSSHGKPELPDRRLEFNISHTEGMAILGFTRGRRIGVDVEHVRSDFHVEEIAERFFSPAERAALRQVSPERRREAFFRIWTRKEAFIKAVGEGLSHPLHQFDVSLDDTAQLIATRPDASEASRWRLENLTVAGGFAAAVAVATSGEPSAAR